MVGKCVEKEFISDISAVSDIALRTVSSIDILLYARRAATHHVCSKGIPKRIVGQYLGKLMHWKTGTVMASWRGVYAVCMYAVTYVLLRM